MPMAALGPGEPPGAWSGSGSAWKGNLYPRVGQLGDAYSYKPSEPRPFRSRTCLCMTRRLAFRLSSFLILGYGFAMVIAGVLLCEMTLHPMRRRLTPADEISAQALAVRQHASLQNVTLAARDGTSLRAWLFNPETPNGTAVILLHGLSDNRMGMIGYAEFLLEHHFTILMPDARAHGASGGAIATYGLLERNDIRDWFDWLDRTMHPSCIDGLGESMGAAQILQAVTVEPGFCAIAAESSFAALREVGYDRVGQFFHTGPWLGRTLFHPAILVAFWWGKEKYHLDLQQVSPADSVATTAIPVLLIHGTADDNIPYRNATLIVARAPRVKLWAVPGVGHCGAINVATDFRARLVLWFSEKCLRGVDSAKNRRSLRQVAKGAAEGSLPTGVELQCPADRLG